LYWLELSAILSKLQREEHEVVGFALELDYLIA
jgi:hypothetical protein